MVTVRRRLLLLAAGVLDDALEVLDDAAVFSVGEDGGAEARGSAGDVAVAQKAQLRVRDDVDGGGRLELQPSAVVGDSSSIVWLVAAEGVTSWGSRAAGGSCACATLRSWAAT
ncbi:hypothetical protein [Actinomycetospora straminea]|uniref:Secreted protein n=1 Tax=Actinomycetospora straminea TaxID=663607 RepID=A0ABP9ELT0_9PSEU|nr:hypothetical protein [Actinomycetospora straminea]MDD7934969.1 hypothetical protein [Actinomycetospora straminea]